MSNPNTCDHGVNPKYCRACESIRNRKVKEEESSELTPEQVQNWRKVMVESFGPYALIMPVKEIIAYKKTLEAEIAAISNEAVAAEAELSK